MLLRTITALGLSAVALGFSTGAAAQVKTWNFGDTSTPGACTGSYSTGSTANYGNVINCTQQPAGSVVDLWARGYSNDRSGSTFRAAGINQQGAGSGFGMYNQRESRTGGAPDHAIDNSTHTDLLLLQFASAEILKSVTIGWSGDDGDFQVLRWIGDAAATLTTVTGSIASKTAGTMVGSGGGWELVTLVDGAGGITTPDVAYGVNAGNLSSSWWIITAYNASFGGSGATTGIDAIKILGVSTGLVSLAGSHTLVLAGLGLLGAGALRRRSA